MLVVFPRRSQKPKAGDASREELQAVTQHAGPIIPIEQKSRELETVSLTDEQKACPKLGIKFLALTLGRTCTGSLSCALPLTCAYQAAPSDSH